jgi:hypothetical protein
VKTIVDKTTLQKGMPLTVYTKASKQEREDKALNTYDEI